MNRRQLCAILGAAASNFPRAAGAKTIDPPEALRLEGFFAFPSIRTGYGPGTILQRYVQSGITKTRVYLELGDLSIEPPIVFLPTEEEIPAITHSTSASIAGALEFVLAAAGLRPKVEAHYSSGSTLAITFGRGYRESIKGADVPRVIQAAVKRGLSLPGHYSLITSTISFRSIDARISSSMKGGLEADLKSAANRVDGRIQISSDQSGILLPRKFLTPMRAFYSWDEIRPASGAVAGAADSVFDRVPGQVELPIELDLR